MASDLLQDYGLIFCNLPGRNTALEINCLAEKLTNGEMDIEAYRKYDKFPTGQTQYMPSTPTQLEFYQEVIGLNCSSDLEACPYRRINDQQLYLSITAYV